VGHKIKHKSKTKKDEIVDVLNEEVEYNDQFVEIANKALNSSIKYKYIVFALIFLAVAVAGTLAFMESSQKKKAIVLSQEFSSALAVFNSDVVPNSEAEGQFKTTKEKLDKAIEEFNSFITAHPNTKLAIISKLYIGNAQYELGNYDEALKSYDDFINSTKDSNLKELVILKKSEIFREKKSEKDAIETLKSIKDSKNEYIASVSLFNLSEIYKEKKDEKLSKEYYEELNKKYPDSYYASKAKLSNKL
jgi:predicted negative regulator of RcsB-dependent stress response